MTQLLAGNTQIKLKRIDIHFQQREVHCTDREVLDYLEDAIRNHSAGGQGVGVTYEGTFHFQDGDEFTATMYVIPDGFTVSMPALAAEEGWPTHEIHLPVPIPPKVKALFKFLDEPWEKVAGTVLVLESGQQPRTIRDESLVAR